MVVVICGCADNGSVRHWVLCVFFKKYMCGVDVLDKGCGGIHVQVYVGFRVFGFGTKDSPLLRTSFSAVVSLLLLRLTIVSVVLGC